MRGGTGLGKGVVVAVELVHRHLYHPADLEHVALLVKDRRRDARRPQLERDEADARHLPLSDPAEDVRLKHDRALAARPRADLDLLYPLLDHRCLLLDAEALQDARASHWRCRGHAGEKPRPRGRGAQLLGGGGGHASLHCTCTIPALRRVRKLPAWLRTRQPRAQARASARRLRGMRGVTHRRGARCGHRLGYIGLQLPVQLQSLARCGGTHPRATLPQPARSGSHSSS